MLAPIITEIAWAKVSKPAFTKRNRHNGSCRGTLNGTGNKGTCKHSRKSVGCHSAQNVAQLRSCHLLQGLTHHLHTIDEQS